MTLSKASIPDPKLDLVLQRVVDVPRELVWLAWTTPEHLKKWFTPSPWQTVDCEIDLRPGGLFRTIMRSPEGHEYPNVGCYLDVIENERLVWTNALAPGFRPAKATAAAATDSSFFAFTAVISLEPHGSGTRYTALVMHGDAGACRRHEQMGFHDGWGNALDQLVATVRNL
jgi:uncharacterized protein YndB with AHSA1/START domain